MALCYCQHDINVFFSCHHIFYNVVFPFHANRMDRIGWNNTYILMKISLVFSVCIVDELSDVVNFITTFVKPSFIQTVASGMLPETSCVMITKLNLFKNNIFNVAL